MPTNKEVLALRWAQKSEEEKNVVRKKTADRIKLLRAKKGQKKRSEMNPEELAKLRAQDRYRKMQRRREMTADQREEIRAKDREATAKKRRQDKLDKEKKKTKGNNKREKPQLDLLRLEKNKMKQLSKNCKTQHKLEIRRTEEEIETILDEKVEKISERRFKMTKDGKMLARIYAREGMREHRRFGFLREYKQRRNRSWKREPHPVSEYFEKVKEVETEEERKAELKRKNRIRVERHRMKVKRMLQEPILIETFQEKGAYELLRERNIKEFEKKKKDSGLFD